MQFGCKEVAFHQRLDREAKMEIEGIVCDGCGSAYIEFNPRNRTVLCNQCGKLSTYARSTLNKNGKICFQRENAIKQFSSGKMDEAQSYAHEVLNIFVDNAPALFIMSYYDEFINKRIGSMKKFFEEIQSAALEYDEVMELESLFLAAAYNMTDYEAEIIKLICANMQAEQDKKSLCDFFDTLCPYMISKRTSMNFFDDERVGMYKDLAGHCGIPKTCFALLKAIEANPDSPYVGNSFYLETKARYFYDKFVIPVGEVVQAINNMEFREKFIMVYKQKREKYKIDAKL